MSSWFDRWRKRKDDEFWRGEEYVDPEPDDEDGFGRRRREIRRYSVIPNFDEDELVLPREKDVLYDVFEESGELVILMRLMGASEDSVKVEVADRLLRVRAKGRHRKYYKLVELPRPVDPSDIRKRLKHGTLEIRARPLATKNETRKK